MVNKKTLLILYKPKQPAYNPDWFSVLTCNCTVHRVQEGAVQMLSMQHAVRH